MTEIIYGPPGTGKTTTLLHEVDGELARGTPPDRIGYVSFTRRAAEEAVTRACEKFNLHPSDLPHFRTLHSLCYKQLGMRSGDVLEGSKMSEFARYAGVTITGRWSEDGTLSGYQVGDRIMHIYNLARVRRIELRQQYDIDDDQLPWTQVQRTVACLHEFKAAHGLKDYNDMLDEFNQSGLNLNLEVLLVDEAQDLSRLQWSTVAKLARGTRRLIVAGDDDQAIYRWAGADVDYLIDLAGSSQVLGQSYRVPPAVQEVASRVIGVVGRRKEKQWAARQGGAGDVARARDLADVDISQGSVMILARNTYLLADRVEGDLRREGIVYERRGHPSIKERYLSAITDWERLRSGHEVTLGGARRIYELMTADRGYRRGSKSLPQFGEDPDRPVTLLELKQQGGLLREDIWHDALDRLPSGDMSYMLAARRRGEKLRAKPRVRLSTIHAAKGGEADHVVLLTDMAPRTHREMQLLPEDEARVWYVAVTRARERLTIIDPHTNMSCPWV